MSEQREALAEALYWRERAERDSRRCESMAEVLHKAVLRAEAAERVAAAVEALAEEVMRRPIPGYVSALQLRAALTPGAADRVRAEEGER